MANELNLTEDQQRRIEEAQTPEEKVRIINEALGIARDGEELSEDELDNISGGGFGWPGSVEEIKETLTLAKLMYDSYGADVANVFLSGKDYPAIKEYAMRTGEGFDDLRQYWLDRLEHKGEGELISPKTLYFPL